MDTRVLHKNINRDRSSRLRKKEAGLTRTNFYNFGRLILYSILDLNNWPGNVKFVV